MCRFLIWGFALAYAGALILLGIGTFGLFGQERDPLSGVFLVPLGLPWNLLGGGLPAPWLPLVGILAPAVNLAILVALCRAFRASAAS
ncbi:MAG: hypothetical protein IT179_20740 [Acidobacteria bacterium]|nr:hypothetical protein [Acidobacteriota bacterium]